MTNEAKTPEHTDGYLEMTPRGRGVDPSMSLSNRERQLLEEASKPHGVLVPNNLGWRNYVRDDLTARGLVTSNYERSRGKFRAHITDDGKAALAGLPKGEADE